VRERNERKRKTYMERCFTELMDEDLD
jgi:hypothetical protein